jgi:hypothetical protein
LDFGSGDPTLWTDDGVEFFVADQLLARRTGDRLEALDGTLMALFVRDGALLVEEDGESPVAIREDLAGLLGIRPNE